MNELILVVDDSALMRKHIGEFLRQQGYRVEIARNGEECLEKVQHFQPDAITLDINMPVMDGLTCLSHIMERNPCPTVMLSSLTKRGAMSTIEAIQLGAVDYVCKPGGTVSLNINEAFPDLLSKIRIALRARVKRPRTVSEPTAPNTKTAERRSRQHTVRPVQEARTAVQEKVINIEPSADIDLIVVGVSTGGPSTLEELLRGLPANFKAPVVIAQHMPATFTHNLAKRLNGLVSIQVEHVERMTSLEPGKVYIARGDADILIQRRNGKLVAQPAPSSENHLWHPSVSRMVESAGKATQAKRIVCVQLTGMGNDGAQEMAQLKQQGALTIAESEETAVVFGMPQELIKKNGASCVLPSHKVANQLVKWVMRTA
jgi:two-component system chemotaxis response regulator CheB